MEDFIPEWGGPSNLEETMKKQYIDDDMVINKSHDKNEEFSSCEHTLFIAIPSRYSPVQS